MAITLADLDVAKNKMIAAENARENAWSGSNGVTSWLSELLKCEGGASVFRNSSYQITSADCGKERKCSNSTFNHRCGQFQLAVNKYTLKVNDWALAKKDYDELLIDYTAEGNAATTHTSNIKTNTETAIRALIVVSVIGAIIAVGVFLYRKYGK